MPSEILGTIFEQQEEDTHQPCTVTITSLPQQLLLAFTHPTDTNLFSSFLVSDSLLKSSVPIQPPIIGVPLAFQYQNWGVSKIPLEITEDRKKELATITMKLAQELTSAQAHILACDGTITQLQAQLIIQNIHLLKINKVLQAKETGKEADAHLRLFLGGFGRILTEKDFIAVQQEAEGRKAVKASQKTQKKLAKENKQAILAEQNHQWDIIKEQNE
ncbi:hypothetical protein M422DRAFT_245534 [Sphaerobolus stellatus SS14]|nr:hypothetical protein M422DRAFT_245534 [Sphaerobolus stellatus SS14]